MAVNPRVFLDITIGGIEQDRIEIDLYRDEVPLVAENFRILCTKDRPVSFKDSIFPYIIRDLVCQGGNLKESDGTRFGTIYGDKFPDVEMSGRRHRPFDLITAHAVPKIPRKHTGPYPYTCGSQFFICFKAAPIFDDQHVVFGTVATGRKTVLNMSAAGSCSGIPTQVGQGRRLRSDLVDLRLLHLQLGGVGRTLWHRGAPDQNLEVKWPRQALWHFG